MSLVLVSTAILLPENLPGVGDDAVVWTETSEKHGYRALARAQIDNLTIEVTTIGENCSGADAFPSGDTPAVRDDLTAPPSRCTGRAKTMTGTSVIWPSTSPRTPYPASGPASC